MVEVFTQILVFLRTYTILGKLPIPPGTSLADNANGASSQFTDRLADFTLPHLD